MPIQKNKTRSDCFAYTYGGCYAIVDVATCCEGCSFYQSKQEYEENRLKAKKTYEERTGLCYEKFKPRP